jgi:transposase
MLRAAERCNGYYRHIQILVRKSPWAVLDETGWKVGGILHWLHVAVTEKATLYLVAAGRGFEESAALIGEDYDGRLIHAGWAPYDCFLSATHGTCNTHLLRRCKLLLETARGGAVRFPRAIKELLKTGLVLRDRHEAGTVSDHGRAVATGRLEARLDQVLDGAFSSQLNRRFARHLRRHQDQVLAYLHHPGMDATSYRAEQALRPGIVNRKVWGGSRTGGGAQAHGKLTTVLRTCVQNGRKILTFISRVLRSQPGHRPVLISGP